MQPACNGTDERLDALLDELRALRADLNRQAPPPPDGQIALREPAPAAPESGPASRTFEIQATLGANTAPSRKQRQKRVRQ